MRNYSNEYNILQDPHSRYFLQSPIKVLQMIRSCQYQLDNNVLRQTKTKFKYKLDPFVIKKLNQQQIEKIKQFQLNTKRIKQIKLEEIKKIKQKFNQVMKQNKIQYKQRKSSLASSNVSMQKNNKIKNKQNNLPFIKGVKQFKKKIL